MSTRTNRSARFALGLALNALLTLTVVANAADDLTSLSDEFTDAHSLTDWRRADELEGWPSRWKTLDVDTTAPGRLFVEPRTSEWFGDWQAPLLFKPVTGDFVVTARVHARGRATDVPIRSFSLLGLMARSPRTDSAADWHPGRENWLFVAVGTGDGGTPQFEVKSTVDSVSTLHLTPARAGWVELRLVRIGSSFVLLSRCGSDPWALRGELERPDLPATLQVGLDAYTDHDTILKYLRRGAYDPVWANGHVLPDEQPDLRGEVEFVRFERPDVPAAWRTLRLTNVPEEDLLRVLGSSSPDQPSTSLDTPGEP
ncbi:hypothetical protein [Deinococcus pimensis]|uniref:hypothetical protein n=1 Tax=Deinococcus pimensis TaxID=309888 RepID=UPI0004B37A7B|nr:hypothetical protein [Deinococcus pimensis]